MVKRQSGEMVTFQNGEILQWWNSEMLKWFIRAKGITYVHFPFTTTI